MSLYRRTVTAIAVTATLALGIVISWLTLTPQGLPDLGPTLAVDKLAHVAAFTALILPSAILRPRFLWWIFPLSALLGFSIELVQPYVGRLQEWMDVVADCVGLIVGTALGLMLRCFLKRYVFRSA